MKSIGDVFKRHPWRSTLRAVLHLRRGDVSLIVPKPVIVPKFWKSGKDQKSPTDFLVYEYIHLVELEPRRRASYDHPAHVTRCGSKIAHSDFGLVRCQTRSRTIPLLRLFFRSYIIRNNLRIVVKRRLWSAPGRSLCVDSQDF